MHFNVVNRKVHHWASFAAAVPLLVIIASGILLQAKKQWAWVQPPEQTGSTDIPSVPFERILASVQAVPGLGLRSWDDIDRLDVRPSKGIVKVMLKNGWEAQVDLGTAAVLQTAYRRSDLIEAIHDGSLFAGDWTKLGLFLPAGLVLLLLWLSGMWMVWVQFIGKRRRRALLRRKAGLAIILAAGLSSAPAAQPSALLVDPLVGHWEMTEDGAHAARACRGARRVLDEARQRHGVQGIRRPS